MQSNDFFAEQCTTTIFCGGKAIRLQEVLKGDPKALVNLHDRPYLDGLLKLLSKQGFRKIVLCVSPATTRIISQIGNGAEYNLNVQYSIDSGLQENADALWVATSLIHTPLALCINGDTLIDINFDQLLHSHIISGAIGTLVASTRTDQPHPGAVEIGLNGWVKDIHEADQDKGKVIIPSPFSLWGSNSGAYVFDFQRLLQNWPTEFRIGKIEQGLLRYLARKGLLWSYNNQDRYLLDIGTKDRLQHARDTLAAIAKFFPI